MALIIEDGTEVANANSYTTDVEYVAYAAARGYTIGTDETTRDIEQLKAMDYLASQESAFKGSRVTQTQLLSYPRFGVVLNKYLLNSDTIPQELKNSQMELAFQSISGDLLINETVSNLSSFNVQGVYSESYQSGGEGQSVRVGKANAYLRNLLKNPIRVVRA